jgi:hypothetical protein
MFMLSTDTADTRILGYTLRSSVGSQVFGSMEDVLQSVHGVPVDQLCWASLADALIDLTWRQEQWGEGTISQTISYWGDGHVQRTTVNNPQGVRLEWDDVL